MAEKPENQAVRNKVFTRTDDLADLMRGDNE